MLLLGGIVLGAATLLACLKFGARRAGAAAVLLAGGLGAQLAPALAFAPLAGLLAGWQVERHKSYGQIVAAASFPGMVQGLLLLVAAQVPGTEREQLVGQVAGQLEEMGLEMEGGPYSVKDVVEVGLRLYPATEFLFILFTVVLIYRLSRAGAGWLGLSLPPPLPFRLWRPWDSLIWVLVAGLALALAGSGLVAELGMNLVAVMGVLYALQGLALVRFFCWRLGISRIPEALLYAALVLTAGLSALALAVFGLLDTWFDWRRLEAPPEETASEQDRAS